MPSLRYAQFRYLAIIIMSWMAVFLVTRSILLFHSSADSDLSILSLFGLYGTGFIYDLGFLLYAVIPLTIYLLLCPRRVWQQRWHRGFMYLLTALSLFAMFFVAVSEWLFWDEFGVRFNFIAVD